MVKVTTMHIHTFKIALFFLTAFGLFSQSFAQENNILSTKMEITVLDELGNRVEGATVKIYENEDDYLGDKNVIAKDITDSKGRVKFTKLNEQGYFVFAEKGKADNSDSAQYSLVLKSGVKNKLNVIITSGD